MFFRKSDGAASRVSSRNGSPSQAELKELRVKARRRLVGALALVLAAVIIVPWVFDDSTPGDQPAPIVVPAPPDTLAAAGSAPTDRGTVDDSELASDGKDLSSVGQDQAAEPGPASGDQATSQAPAETADETTPRDSAKGAKAEQQDKPDRAETSKKEPAAKKSPDKPAEQRSDAQKRADDESLVLALLGEKPASKAATTQPRPSDKGSYYLQVAAYTAEQDALQRRDKLRQAGVTDAYVEKGQSSGRTVYRLRVGPFGSHDAAQAAQTRLRALGYQNGLIAQ